MRPIALKLRGAIGLRDGLNLDSIEVDFSKFSPGLVCIVGSNGSGKTTMMDNLHPFLELPSRPGSFSEQFYLRDSMRDLTFEMNGQLYRSYILIDGQTGKTEAYLYRQNIPLNDGKITTYKSQVEGLMGTPELFFKSIFSAQGTSGIAALPIAKRKELFFELLGLQIYDAYFLYAGNVLTELEKDFSGQKSLQQQYDHDILQRPAFEEALKHERHQLVDVRAELKIKERELKMTEHEHRTIETLAAEQKRKQSEHRQLQCDIASLEQKLRLLEKNSEQEISDLHIQRGHILKEITRLNLIIKRKDEIGSKIQTLHTLRLKDQEFTVREKESIASQRQQSDKKLLEQKRINQLHRDLARLEREEQKIMGEAQRLRIMADAELGALERRLKDTLAAAAPLETAPCYQHEDISSNCPFLTNAKNAAQETSSLKEKIEQLKTVEYNANGRLHHNNTLETIRQRKDKLFQALNVQESDADSCENIPLHAYDAEEHKDIKQQIAELEKKKWEQLQVEVRVSESVLKEKDAILQNLSSQMNEKKESCRGAASEIQDQITLKRARCIELKDDEDYSEKENQCRMQLKTLEQVCQNLRVRELEVHSKMTAAETALERLQTLEIKAKANESAIFVLQRKIESWKFFQRACCKDGIPALELDAAGPAVSRIANDLLSSSFGGRFQIAFETTKLSKDRKKQLETFAIRILGEGGEKHIEDLSQGERVWIERAISEAIAIYLSQKSGRQYLTTFQDESDGALDPENKQNYLKMLRESFKLGQRYFTFIITQTPEIWQQVEQRIHLSPGKQIEVVY